MQKNSVLRGENRDGYGDNTQGGGRTGALFHPFTSEFPHGVGAACQTTLAVILRGRVGLTGRYRPSSFAHGLFTTGFIPGDRERSIRRHAGYAQLPTWAANPR